MSTVDLMADLPFGFSSGDDPDREKREKNDPNAGAGNNPFGFGGDFDMANLGQLFTRLGEMFGGVGSAMASGKDAGPVNYDLARQVASGSIGFVAPIPATTNSAIADAVHLAETWLNGATALPEGTTRAVGWSPSDWVDNTLGTWKRLCDPMAQQISSVWAQSLPEEAKGMAGPLLQMMSQMGGIAFGSQLGQALGRLSKEVLTSTDIGLPLGPKGIAAILPDAVESFAEGLEQPRSEIMTFLAAREAAHHRLFSHVPWLSSQLLGAVEAYAAGMQIDMTGIEELARDFNPASLADPAAMENLLSQGVFEPKATPAQTQALERLETLLALIEGWVQTVVTAALGDRLPGEAALSETLRRRRASGGPAEQTFATLVGLELRPRKLREAGALWQRLTDAAGMDARDAVWQHPDLLPGADDLDDPAAFIDRIVGGDTSGIDAAIAELEDDIRDDPGPVDN
ncbi:MULTISPECIES: zinc-dependent metalloprotease [unclassified Mycobacterium]|uniref:zinc-dependent metalloprotease n=1 Tax=unclassified Mycobacterium TaxID=2642494 RepID=UPI002741ABE9|nr:MULTISPECIES: zinc-dependent metalloprotease [unclassified Mycobacterium]MDP7703475.1 zinc-dependent metalloprotease [Mycobacterium sp. TY815]MDP7721958.1 zinc-dependent metalloprotease [Mycobacterium sp. TY814]